MGEPAEGRTNLLDFLPPRPPTPPREASNDSGADASLLVVSQLIDPERSLHTPPNIHSSASVSSTGSRSKRVEFSEPHADPDCRPQDPTPAAVPPPSSSRPARSILKVAALLNPIDPDDISADDEPSMPAMLESTVHQLAGADRHSRLDAYVMLGRALKASDNLPDRIALQQKMGLFMQFIKRDMTCGMDGGAIDATLINQSVNLLKTFLHFPAIASTLSSDFGIFAIDHLIRSLEEGTLPKDVTRHLMQIGVLQNFSPRVMTSDRVGRLVAALHGADCHRMGKSLISLRMHIYWKLVRQCKQYMLVNLDWMRDLFTDMLSPVKEIRLVAISLGLAAAFDLGREKQVTRRAMELMQLAPEGERYIEFYNRQLTTMAKDRRDSANVPQIWSIVILLLGVPDKWDYFTTWLRVINPCFNCSEFQTRHEAQLRVEPASVRPSLQWSSVLEDATETSGGRISCNWALGWLQRRKKPSVGWSLEACATFCTMPSGRRPPRRTSTLTGTPASTP